MSVWFVEEMSLVPLSSSVMGTAHGHKTPRLPGLHFSPCQDFPFSSSSLFFYPFSALPLGRTHEALVLRTGASLLSKCLWTVMSPKCWLLETGPLLEGAREED